MRRRVREAVILFLSSVMFALALNVFLIPSEIVAGGFSGLAIILNILFNMPVGFTVILLNIPFLAANARLHGKGYIKRAFIGVMLTGIMSEFLSDLGQISDNRVVNAVLGGALMGASLGCIFALGYTTGGTDLAATLIRVKYSSLGLGTALFICDFAIIMLA
ncbi:MAG: YitT family protein, partial [Clostridia bacterium]|nr:YitT family protein [Clostridia bacterium]